MGFGESERWSGLWPGAPRPRILTVPTPGPSFKDESVGDGPIAPEVGQLPLPHDSRGDVPGHHKDVIAEVKGGGAALQLGAWRHRHVEPVHWGQGRGEGITASRGPGEGAAPGCQHQMQGWPPTPAWLAPSSPQGPHSPLPGTRPYPGSEAGERPEGPPWSPSLS